LYIWTNNGPQCCVECGNDTFWKRNYTYGRECLIFLDVLEEYNGGDGWGKQEEQLAYAACKTSKNCTFVPMPNYTQTSLLSHSLVSHFRFILEICAKVNTCD
jgi:hypothetical protein